MQETIKNSLKKRYQKELRFKAFGIASIAFAIFFLLVFLSVIFIKGNQAFFTHKIALEIDFSQENILQNSEELNGAKLDGEQILQSLHLVSFRRIINHEIDQKFLAATKDVKQLISDNAEFSLRDILRENPEFLGTKQQIWLELSSKADVYFKYDIASSLVPSQTMMLDELKKQGQIRKFFNIAFFTQADSREPESAGVAASLIGSFLMMIVFLSLAFPIGVMCAFYLEEFAPKNKVTDLIEISINNLAAIPSIIYGLLGLTLYLNFMSLPRSSALVGGMTLFMLVLPTVIIATRNTIRTIPQSIRDAAIALGASKVQLVLHHLLPLSIPGIMTGTILAMSRALGETAPLLMIGMVAFIADVPHGFFEPTSVLPVQIFLWSDSPEIGFAEKTSAAIMVLLSFLILFNLLAIILRKKFERKW